MDSYLLCVLLCAVHCDGTDATRPRDGICYVVWTREGGWWCGEGAEQAQDIERGDVWAQLPDPAAMIAEWSRQPGSEDSNEHV